MINDQSSMIVFPGAPAFPQVLAFIRFFHNPLMTLLPLQ